MRLMALCFLMTAAIYTRWRYRLFLSDKPIIFGMNTMKNCVGALRPFILYYIRMPRRAHIGEKKGALREYISKKANASANDTSSSIIRTLRPNACTASRFDALFGVEI
jgi:hypothetical protein